MRIITYITKIDKESNLNILVKEKAVNYETYTMLNSPDKVADMLNATLGMQQLAEEFVYLLALNTKSRLIGMSEISHGTAISSFMQPREVLIKALLCGATSIVLAHNHPSGDTSPSREDIMSTKRLLDACNLMGIQLSDHIIIGDTYYSFKEHGII